MFAIWLFRADDEENTLLFYIFHFKLSGTSLPPILRQQFIIVMIKYLIKDNTAVVVPAIKRLQPIRQPPEILRHFCCFIMSQHLSTSSNRKPYFPGCGQSEQMKFHSFHSLESKHTNVKRIL